MADLLLSRHPNLKFTLLPHLDLYCLTLLYYAYLCVYRASQEARACLQQCFASVWRRKWLPSVNTFHGKTLHQDLLLSGLR